MAAVEHFSRRLERAAKTSHGSLGGGKRCDFSACSEDIRCRGRSVGTRFEEILPSPERCNQKSVFLGWPLSRCYDQGGMQRRLSTRSSSVVEGSRSGGGSDSELNHVTRTVPPKVKTIPNDFVSQVSRLGCLLPHDLARLLVFPESENMESLRCLLGKVRNGGTSAAA